MKSSTFRNTDELKVTDLFYKVISLQLSLVRQISHENFQEWKIIFNFFIILLTNNNLI